MKLSRSGESGVLDLDFRFSSRGFGERDVERSLKQLAFMEWSASGDMDDRSLRVRASPAGLWDSMRLEVRRAANALGGLVALVLKHTVARGLSIR
jgi:hypothetical protein